jgi:hypothetical protein
MTPDPSPVAVFAWQRPRHLQRVLDSLSANAEASDTDLFVFVDGPRHAREASLTDEVIKLTKGVTGFRSVSCHISERNLGLSRSITQGVARVLRDSNTVIVVEDDILVSQYFLRYMNDYLLLYENDEDVASIHAYVYPHDQLLPSTFFMRGADCWGWATWQRAWARYRPDGASLLAELVERNLGAEFDLGGVADYLDMLRDQIAGRNDSWAIRWHASTFLAGMFTLYPNRPLAMNIGADGSGSHGGFSTSFDVDLSQSPVEPSRIPVEESVLGRRAFARFFAARQGSSVKSRGLRQARRALRPLWRRVSPSLRYRIAQWLRHST